MKTHSCLTLWSAVALLACSVQAADLSLPILQTVEAAVVDPGTGDGPYFRHTIAVRNASGPQDEYYNVSPRLVPANSGRPLRATATRLNFLAEESVGSANQEYVDEFGDKVIFLPGFDETREVFGNPWRYIDSWATGPASFGKTLRSQTEFFIGFRFTGDDGLHYGWMRFSRPDTNFLTLFLLTAWDWNPLPGEPIAAGQPPGIPLTPKITAEGLRLTWPGAVAGWILESSAELGPNAPWETVPDVAPSSVVVTLTADRRFFRLRKP